MTTRPAGLLGLVVSTFLLITGTLLVSPASAAFPGANGKLAYQVAGQIWTVNPDGTAKRRLTADSGNSNPRWSADGRRIAFTHSRNVFVMNADGSGRRQVASGGRDLKPAWSPDGKQLVFIRLQANGRGDLFRVPSAGGAVQRITPDATTTGGNDRPSWSPKGGTILFLQYRQAGLQSPIIKTVTVATKQQRVVPAGVPVTGDSQVSDTVSSPEWAPDGAHILFLARCDSPGSCAPAAVNVMRSDLRTTTRAQVTSYVGIDGEWDDLRGFTAAPNGTSIAEVGCWNFDPRTQTYAFCGLRPGSVANAVNPDWQPRRPA